MKVYHVGDDCGGVGLEGAEGPSPAGSTMSGFSEFGGEVRGAVGSTLVLAEADPLLEPIKVVDSSGGRR